MHSDYALSGAEGIEKVRAAHEADNDYNVCLIDWKMPNMDGIETTRRIRELVFMDIRMPVMDGLEATRLIRELPKGKGINVPIVAMSANAFAEDVETAFAAGLDDYLSKPINLEKLYGIMKKYFK